MPKKEPVPLNKNLSQIKNRSSSSRIVVQEGVEEQRREQQQAVVVYQQQYTTRKQQAVVVVYQQQYRRKQRQAVVVVYTSTKGGSDQFISKFSQIISNLAKLQQSDQFISKFSQIQLRISLKARCIIGSGICSEFYHKFLWHHRQQKELNSNATVHQKHHRLVVQQFKIHQVQYSSSVEFRVAAAVVRQQWQREIGNTSTILHQVVEYQ